MIDPLLPVKTKIIYFINDFFSPNGIPSHCFFTMPSMPGGLLLVLSRAGPALAVSDESVPDIAEYHPTSSCWLPLTARGDYSFDLARDRDPYRDRDPFRHPCPSHVCYNVGRKAARGQIRPRKPISDTQKRGQLRAAADRRRPSQNLRVALNLNLARRAQRGRPVADVSTRARGPQNTRGAAARSVLP